MPEPTDQKLYNHVKSLANKKFQSPSGIYRSSWIVKEYKKRGGKYSGVQNKNSGLKRWFKENWIDINRPIKNSKGKITGYHKCGRKSSKKGGVYPLCRPSIRITSKSPKTYKEISKSAIDHAKKLKKNYTYKRNISFNKKSAKRSVKKSTKRSIKRSAKRSVKKISSKRSIKRSAKRSVKKRSAKRSVKKRFAKRSTKKRSAKRSVKKISAKRSIKRSAKRSTKKRSTKRSIKRSVKRSVKKSAKSSIKKRSTKHSIKRSKRSVKKRSAKRLIKKSSKRSTKH